MEKNNEYQPPNNSQGGEKDRGYAKSNAPSLSLPKGGGAIKGIDEKFNVNAINGTSGMSIPLPFGKVRSEFSPALTIGYNSGGGNSEFGLGWSLSLANISRKLDKRLPQYEDGLESDIFLFVGAEDLVPEVDVNHQIVRTTQGNYTITRYMPRIEGLFARIEKIQETGKSYFYWKVTTKDNITTFFGSRAITRLSDPDFEYRVYRWLPDLSYDDKGNVHIYEYKVENLNNVPKSVYEIHRHDGYQKFSNVYLKSVHYGNYKPFYESVAVAFKPNITAVYTTVQKFFYSTVFDFGEHDITTPTPVEVNSWTYRKDAFSQYNAGFEIRSYRLCSRVLFFSHFSELGISPYLTHSIDFTYKFQGSTAQLLETDYIIEIRHRAYRKTALGGYDSQSLPPMTLEYSEPIWNTAIQNISSESLVNDPIGLVSPYQWVDFYGEGISGVLTEQAEGWYYKSNLGNGEFSPAQKVAPKPNLVGLNRGNIQVQDLEANGKKYIVSTAKGMQGFFEMDEDEKWKDFVPFQSVVNINTNDPNIRMLDLTGDGMPDILMTQENVFVWYEADGRRGYKPAQTSLKVMNEHKGVSVVFSDELQRIYLADMSGDGMSDIVRIQNGSICYWPNLGYGRFGAMVRMSAAPHFDHPEQFNPTYIHLTDISGTGASDIIYLGQDRFRAWLNYSGNGWSEAKEIEPFPDTASPSALSVVDLLGNGTSCIVWSSSLPAYSNTPMRYIDLMDSTKPYLMKKYLNNAGKEVSLTYKNSVAYYLEDKKIGKPWLTKLPFPVHCVASQTIKDLITNTEYSSYYTYHHGYYDHEEREFRGFGRVETLDSERIVMSSNGMGDINEPPIYTKTWYHTGAWLRDSHLIAGYKKEYFKAENFNGNTFSEKDLTQDPVDSTWSAIERREAYRALKGSPLRSEVYALDGSTKESYPYSTTEYKYDVNLIQHRAELARNEFQLKRFAVFMVLESESMSYHYERNPADPRIAQNVKITVDEYGNVLESASVVYPRLNSPTGTPTVVQTEQAKRHIIYTVNEYTNDISAPNGAYRLRMGWSTKSYELTGATPTLTYFEYDELGTKFTTSTEIDYHATAGSGLKRRCIEAQIILYLKDDVSGVLPDGQIDSKGIPYETYRQAFTTALFNAVYSGKYSTTDLVSQAKYIQRTIGSINTYWIPSGTIQYFSNPQNSFYAPQRYNDPFGGFVELTYYSDYYLLLESTKDALNNEVSVVNYDFRLLRPIELKDLNDNLSEMAYDILGMPVGMAVKGKGTQGDDLTGFVPDLNTTQKNNFFSNPRGNATLLLANATARYIYDYESTPLRVATILREEHVAVDPNNLNAQIAVEYSDGLGRLLMKKVMAEQGEAKKLISGVLTVVNTSDRWVGTGRTILNNKSKPIRQYEPYFSDGCQYESEPQLVDIGYSPTLYYDSVGRVIRTDMPDGTYSYTTFDAWEQTVYDAGDTVNTSPWKVDRSGGGSLATIPEEVDALTKSLNYANTPTTIYTDSLARAIYTRQRLTGTQFVHTYTVLDIEGNPRSIIDPRGLTQLTYQYDMLGHQIYQNSMDSGEAWLLHDAFGKPIYSCDNINKQTRITYDIAHRPLHTIVQMGVVNKMISQIIYGEGQTNDKTLNLRGKPYETYDGSGKTTVVEYDFRGNVLHSQTEIIEDGTLTDVDWLSPPTLSTYIYTTLTAYDALNRPKTQTDPDNNLHEYSYSESGSLKEVKFTPSGLGTQTVVQDIHHNAKGQREAIWYGNNTKTSYTYNEKNYRLTRILTINLNTNDTVQDLNYYYDAVGNITTVKDDAQQTVFFSNAVIKPQQEFTYDALYRLIEASGREKIGIASMGTNDNYDDIPWMGETMPGADGNAVQGYTQYYTYDESGNMLQMQHSTPLNPSTGYTRDYIVSTTNNQLINTQIGSDSYMNTYDGLGNLMNMPHLSAMDYNLQNMQAHITRGTEDVYYQYRGGQRSRKFVNKQGGLTEERIYLGNFEIYRTFVGGNLDLERKTVHISDDTGRIAMYEYRTAGSDSAPVELMRYIYSNNLSSSMLELDDHGDIISYEEYHPFGTTAYQATNSTINAVAKRYRYTGKERDEESGLYYHGARYYIPWLCRWTQCDPIGIKDGLNVYAYVSNNPVMLHDPSGMGGEDPKPMKKRDAQGNLTNENVVGKVKEVKITPQKQPAQDGQLAPENNPAFQVEKLHNARTKIANDKKVQEQQALIKSIKDNQQVLLPDGRSMSVKDLKRAEAEYNAQVGQNITGGIFGAFAYVGTKAFGGTEEDAKKASFAGAAVDNMSQAASVKRLNPQAANVVSAQNRQSNATPVSTSQPNLTTRDALKVREVNASKFISQHSFDKHKYSPNEISSKNKTQYSPNVNPEVIAQMTIMQADKITPFYNKEGILYAIKFEKTFLFNISTNETPTMESRVFINLLNPNKSSQFPYFNPNK